MRRCRVKHLGQTSATQMLRWLRISFRMFLEMHQGSQVCPASFPEPTTCLSISVAPPLRHSAYCLTWMTVLAYPSGGFVSWVAAPQPIVAVWSVSIGELYQIMGVAGLVFWHADSARQQIIVALGSHTRLWLLDRYFGRPMYQTAAAYWYQAGSFVLRVPAWLPSIVAW